LSSNAGNPSVAEFLQAMNTPMATQESKTERIILSVLSHFHEQAVQR